eukprot:TRINITY_DN44228_c0_g1_i1.p1 TRINITY_DN44228_c0_g1~~TRINITY_DN44228_c0_g1_i1.p1  ORF type:complete len:568 (+),score=75.75 TRINITY_DN44228_c0_g1_i1:26-1729(+)
MLVSALHAAEASRELLLRAVARSIPTPGLSRLLDAALNAQDLAFLQALTCSAGAKVAAVASHPVRNGASRLLTTLRAPPAHKLNTLLQLAARADGSNGNKGGLVAVATERGVLRSGLVWERARRRRTLQGETFTLGDRAEIPIAALKGDTLARVLSMSDAMSVKTGHERWLVGVVDAFLSGSSSASSCIGAARDPRNGQTALHVAARWGYAALIQRLLDAGVDSSVRDIDGRTAAHVAASFGHIETSHSLGGEGAGSDLWGRMPTEISEWQAHRSGCAFPSDDLWLRKSLGNLTGAHWIEGPAATVESLDVSGPKDYLEILASGSLMTDYVACGKPVMLRGAAQSFPAAKTWNAELLAQFFGDLPLRHTAWWPESAANAATPVDLRAYLGACFSGFDRETTNAASSFGFAEVPSYFFETPPRGPMRKRLQHDVPLLPQGLKVIEEFVSLVRPPQIAVGTPRSGAPAHFHFPALNALLLGKKRWLLFPPAVAFWSAKPPMRWFAEELPVWRERSASAIKVGRFGMLEVDQAAGDVLLVPDGWGHITLVGEPTVSANCEFVPRAAPLRP